jgi:hypothetical protein
MEQMRFEGFQGRVGEVGLPLNPVPVRDCGSRWAGLLTCSRGKTTLAWEWRGPARGDRRLTSRGTVHESLLRSASAPLLIYQAVAIVLRRLDYAEADRILTILSREHGKFAAIAPNAAAILSEARRFR